MELPVHQASATDAVDDRELMLRLKRGDETALAPLMDRWELPTKSVIARLVLNASEAEDLAQETFVRVWQQRDKYRDGAEFRPWLFAIAVNLARNRLRWWRRRPTVSLDEWTGANCSGGTRPTVPAAALGDGQDASVGAAKLERAERARSVRDAIAALPVDLREAIVLYEYERMSQLEIAGMLGTTAKAIETRVYRAKEKLRVALAGLK